MDMLHRAVDAQQHDGVRLIIEIGVDINGIVPGTALDRAVLQNAAGGDSLEMVRLLVELGADPNLRDATYSAHRAQQSNAVPARPGDSDVGAYSASTKSARG